MISDSSLQHTGCQAAIAVPLSGLLDRSLTFKMPFMILLPIAVLIFSSA
jgi:hypothetical protein